MTKHLTKPIRAIHFMVLAFLMTLSSPVVAQGVEKGYAAAQAGDFATALQVWLPLAEQGEAFRPIQSWLNVRAWPRRSSRQQRSCEMVSSSR